MPEQQITEEMLMRYADGALPADQRRIVTEALPRHPELMRNLESYLFTRDMPAFDEVMNVPAWLIGNVKAMQPKPRGILQSLWFRPPRTAMWALAAVLALLLAGASGWVLRDAVHPEFVHHDVRGLVAAAALAQALETTPVGQTEVLSGDLALRPRSTFYSSQKRWYRHYDLLYGAGLQSSGLAFRGPDGSWRVVHQDPPAKPAPAGQALGPQNGSLIEVIRDKIRDGGVLTLEEEKSVMGARWQPKP